MRRLGEVPQSTMQPNEGSTRSSAISQAGVNHKRPSVAHKRASAPLDLQGSVIGLEGPMVKCGLGVNVTVGFRA